MRTVLLLVISSVLACGAKGKRAQQHSCIRLDAARAEQAASAKQNRANLEAAIVARGLSLLAIPSQTVGIDKLSPEWRTRTQPSGETIVLAPIANQGCGDSPRFELVRNDKGEVWGLYAAARATRKREVDTCACMSEQPVTCGGAAPPPLQLGFTLPPDLTFRGEVRIDYDVEDLRLVFADMRQGSSCPRMPPPPEQASHCHG